MHVFLCIMLSLVICRIYLEVHVRCRIFGNWQKWLVVGIAWWQSLFRGSWQAALPNAKKRAEGTDHKVEAHVSKRATTKQPDQTIDSASHSQLWDVSHATQVLPNSWKARRQGMPTVFGCHVTHGEFEAQVAGFSVDHVRVCKRHLGTRHGAQRFPLLLCVFSRGHSCWCDCICSHFTGSNMTRREVVLTAKS